MLLSNSQLVQLQPGVVIPVTIFDERLIAEIEVGPLYKL
jgi:hypothetical protein